MTEQREPRPGDTVRYKRDGKLWEVAAETPSGYIISRNDRSLTDRGRVEQEHVRREWNALTLAERPT